MTNATLASAHGELLHRPADTGASYWGPGDVYRFLVTGAETGGAYFAMEAIVPPAAARRRTSTATRTRRSTSSRASCEFLLGDRARDRRPGDFVNVPRGTVHRFRNAGAASRS